MRLTPIRLAQAPPANEIITWLRANRIRSPDRLFTHITSEALCDDVLQNLKTSLPAPHTCDLLDINPGTCLWSQKLHELIKPRRHILVERNHRHFADHIDPLLAEPGSSYRLATSLNAALDPKARLLSEDVYNFRKSAAQEGRPGFILNPSLLMTVNLSGRARKAAGFVGTQAKQFLNDHYRATFIREDYAHQYGLIRLLAWVAEDAQQAVVPTCVNNRTKQSIQLESAFHLEKVAGPSLLSVTPHQRRWFHLDLENQQEVRKRQEQQGVYIPPDRQQPDPLPDFSSLNPNIEVIRRNKDLYPDHQVFIQRLLELDERISQEDPEWYEKYQIESLSGFRKGRRRATPDAQMQKNRSTYRSMNTEFRTQHNTHYKAFDFLWETRQLYLKLKNAWMKGWFSQPPNSEASKHRNEVRKLTEDDNYMQVRRKDLKRDTRSLVTKTVDDYMCFDVTPRSMVWNRRQQEPLLVRPDEFYPRNNTMNLFDITPNPNLQENLDTVDKQICFDYVCTQLMTYPGDTVMRAIKRIVPGGADLFLERLPELRNIERGGSWNLENVRVRTLHHDLFIAIALAFYNWPHRPGIQTLMTSYKGVFDKGPL